MKRRAIATATVIPQLGAGRRPVATRLYVAVLAIGTIISAVCACKNAAVAGARSGPSGSDAGNTLADAGAAALSANSDAGAPANSYGGAAASSSSGGGAASTDAAAGACGKPPPMVVSERPTGVGCYAAMNGGWLMVPCNCELPLDNTTHSAVQVRLTLSLSSASVAPVLDGSPDIEASFDDPDASWYNAWAAQGASGNAFKVSRNGGVTTVRLGANSIVLAPVSLPACESRMGSAKVVGTFSATLYLTADLSDVSGAVLGTSKGSCENPLPP